MGDACPMEVDSHGRKTIGRAGFRKYNPEPVRRVGLTLTTQRETLLQGLTPFQNSA